AIGMEGGGTGTRAVRADRDGRGLGRGRGGPSGLGLGIERAWASIGAACGDAFTQAGLAFDWSQCALGCGLAGVNNAAWLAAFRAQAPLGALAIESDAYTTVVGAPPCAPT
ncbi:ATPase, partial [Burkholderia cenocepacia]|nr:ATPase [Burkholderia cenocepacia]